MKVMLSPQAQKDLSRLPRSAQKKVVKKLLMLENNPLSGKKLGGELSGRRSLRAWPYRITYTTARNGSVEISTILHRQGAYK